MWNYPNNLVRHTLVPLSNDRVQHQQSTSDRFHTRAHTGLTPAGPPPIGPTHKHTRASHPRFTGLQAYTTKCAWAQDIADPALIPIVGPKLRELAQPGAHSEEVLLHPKS